MFKGKNKSVMINSLFKILDKIGLPYCVLRNYDALPFCIDGDIDICISKKARKILPLIIEKFQLDFNLIPLSIVKRNYVWIYRFLVFEGDKIDVLKIDFHIEDEVIKWGLKFLSQGSILRNRLKYRSFFVADPVSQGLCVLFRSFFASERLREKDINNVYKVLTNEEEFLKSMYYILGDQKLALLILKMIKMSTFDFKSLKNRIFLSLLVRNLINRPFDTLISFVMHFISEVRHFLDPKGIMVVFLGPDGVGKSRVVQETINTLAQLKLDVKRFYWRPNIFRQPGVLMGLRDEEARDNPSPHNITPQNPILSFLRLTYYLLDFVLGYLLKIKFLLSKDVICIFDRYYYDAIIDSYRYNFQLPKWILNLGMRIVPRPNLTVILDAPPEVILTRKRELPYAELKRQRREFLEISKRIKSCFVVDNSRLLDETLSEIIEMIIKIKQEKC